MRGNNLLKERSRTLRENMTDAEHLLWYLLRSRHLKEYKFRRQHILSPYIVDFICIDKKLVIELDGGQHCENTYDLKRTLFLQTKGYKVIRFWNHDVLTNIESVLDAIFEALTRDNK